MPRVDSSAIDRIGYSRASRILKVWYAHNPQAYLYFDVPEAVYRAFLEAQSKGTFVNDVVKPHYRFRRPPRAAGARRLSPPRG